MLNPILNPPLVSHNEIDAMIAAYNLETSMGISIIKEHQKMRHLFGSVDDEDGRVLKLSFSGSDVELNDYVKALRVKYWKKLFQSDTLTKSLTNKARQEHLANVSEMKDFEFNAFNIDTLRNNVIMSLKQMIDDVIFDLFEEFTVKHCYHPDFSKNVHLYDGWKTNEAYKIGSKAIIPLNGYNWYDKNKLDLNYKVLEKFQDIEKAFDYLKGVKTDSAYMNEVFKSHNESQESKGIKLKYFTADFFKKGTVHIKFTDLELLKKLNIFGSMKKNWLPPSYGKKSYVTLSKDEKMVIDSFEGEDSYKETCKNHDKYIIKENILLIA